MGLPRMRIDVKYCGLYGVHMVRTSAGVGGNSFNVAAAARNAAGQSGTRADSRPAAAQAVCGFGEFLPDFCGGAGGGVCGAASDSTVSFHHSIERTAHSSFGFRDHYAARCGVRLALRGGDGRGWDIDFSQPADVDFIWSGSGAYAGRICVVGEFKRCVLVEPGTVEH